MVHSLHRELFSMTFRQRLKCLVASKQRTENNQHINKFYYIKQIDIFPQNKLTHVQKY